MRLYYETRAYLLPEDASVQLFGEVTAEIHYMLEARLQSREVAYTIRRCSQKTHNINGRGGMRSCLKTIWLLNAPEHALVSLLIEGIGPLVSLESGLSVAVFGNPSNGNL